MTITTISRRTLIAALAAAPAAAAPGHAFAGPEVSGSLRELIAAYEAALAVYDAACIRYDEAETRAELPVVMVEIARVRYEDGLPDEWQPIYAPPQIRFAVSMPSTNAARSPSSKS